MDMKVKLLIFLHIAKTGGTSLGVALQYVYGYRSTLHVCYDGWEAPEWFVKMPDAKRQRIDAVKGHVQYGVHEYFRRPANYVTMLRDPIDRIASLHRMYGNEHPDHWKANLSLGEFVDQAPETYSGFNGQTCALAGVPNDDEIEYTESLLAKAKQHLDAMPAFGLTERYDEGLILMKRRLGWSRWPYYVTSRVGKTSTGEREPISDAVRERIKEQNSLDVRLYEYARQRFNAMVAEEGPGFQEDVRTFKQRNRLVDAAFSLPLWLYRRGRRLLYLLRH